MFRQVDCFVHDGESRLITGIRTGAVDAIRRAVVQEFQPQLDRANAFRRIGIRLAMNREIERRLQRAVQAGLPHPDTKW